MPIGLCRFNQVEEIGDVRHEFVKGRIEAMVGGSSGHNKISSIIQKKLSTYLKNTPCSVYISDMKVKTEDAYYYPDVMAVCTPVPNDSMCQTEPVVADVCCEGSDNAWHCKHADVSKSDYCVLSIGFWAFCCR